MTERERLIELLTDNLPRIGDLPKCDNPLQYKDDEIVGRLADHLFSNGVIVPPMRLGQTCFRPSGWRNEVDECKVSSITQKADGSLKIRYTILRYKSVGEITASDVGKVIFLTREEAEEALKGREQE